MVGKLFKKVFGTKNDRELKSLRKIVEKINQHESSFKELSDEQLRNKTAEFKARLSAGESLDQLLPEAFSAVREAAGRSLGMRHFDTQMIGGMVLHEGKIAEMRTGEGKTLVATLPAYLNALTGEGVYLVTVNDYLARRDASWMSPVYLTLGMTVGIVQSHAAGAESSFLLDNEGENPVSRQQAYAADITYGTNNEFGFDYLRDNMVLRLEQKSQRGLAYAIVDEVDSILIDEARTPLIISGQADDSSELYKKVNKLVQGLTLQLEKTVADEESATNTGDDAELEPEGDFSVDEKVRQVELTEVGHEKVEELLLREGLLTEGESLYQAANLGLLQHVHGALRAQHMFHKDVEYIVQQGEVVLIDEHTGRTMPGRRLSEGLHQAIEAKEGVAIQSESQTLASTTFQNYFRLFGKLAGMTGTADTEAFEFHQIYGLPVVVIPTNMPVAREDLNDLIFLTQGEKFNAVVADVRDCIDKGAPVLVGTASIETSELLSTLLNKEKISHQVLNAKFHEKEAQIVAEAGVPARVTIATNMAGRGTDIVLGGNLEVELAALENPSDDLLAATKVEWQKRHDQVIAAGGLHILSTERHESRRIDNQLRGRAGRQGDPGVSRFYLSLEDSLMRLFASERVKNMMRAIGMEQGEAIEHRMVTSAIERAQRKVEGHNFDMRKQLLEYDDVANDQRQVIYEQRNDLLASESINEIITAVQHDVVNQVVENSIPAQSLPEQWNIAGLEQDLLTEINIELPLQAWLDDDKRLNEEGLKSKIMAASDAAYQQRCERIGEDIHTVERQVMLQVLDNLWKEHLANIDHLRQGIGLRAYAQKNPKQEYKRESFELFQEMLENIKLETVRFLSRVEIRREDEAAELERQRQEAFNQQQMEFNHEQSQSALVAADAEPPAELAPLPEQPFVRGGEKVGRNAPCPCGSGKKFKQCHGKLN
ncbi:preprotein translocase subunit SecA [Gammaproteobacteria bacterium 53_120_T64]|nr:preprotein translocase subunit SecA [Gammaproteobacteria bacterium 53_120_T64]